MMALATRSDETAARGGTPKKRTRTGVMRAPPPMPVRPTTMPMPKAATESRKSMFISSPVSRVPQGLPGHTQELQTNDAAVERSSHTHGHAARAESAGPPGARSRGSRDSAPPGVRHRTEPAPDVRRGTPTRPRRSSPRLPTRDVAPGGRGRRDSGAMQSAAFPSGRPEALPAPSECRDHSRRRTAESRFVADSSHLSSGVRSMISALRLLPKARMMSRLGALGLSAILTAGCTRTTNLLNPATPGFFGSYAATAQSAASREVRIVTFNIKLSRSIDRAIRVLENDSLAGADIIALQEMDDVGVDLIARA